MKLIVEIPKVASAFRDRSFLVYLLLLIGACPVGAEDLTPDVEINAVEIVGTRVVDAAVLVDQLQHGVGSLSRKTIAEEIKRLYKTGFFAQVEARLQADGALHYVVREKPLVRKLMVRGNDEIDTDELEDVIKLEGRRFFDSAKAQALAKAAKSYYESEGYYDAEVSFSVEDFSADQVDLVFDIEEGPHYLVREVRFLGLEAVAEDELTDLVQTRRFKWWSSWLFGTGRVNRDLLKNDKEFVRQYLLNNGYIENRVADPWVEKKDDGLYVYFQVEEGPQYLVGEIRASGDLIEEDEEKTLSVLEIESGDVFSGEVVRGDTFRISDRFGDRGYAFANVVPRTDINREEKVVDLTFEIDRGKLVKVNRVRIRGNQKTSDNVVRREVELAEQEQYSRAKVERSEQLLQRLGYFEEVSVATEALPDSDEEVDLIVNLREASTGTFSIGAGFSSADGVLLHTRLTENNVFGTGRSATVNLDIGTRRETYIFSLQDRRFLDTRWSLGGALQRADREYTDFDRLVQGGSLAAGHPLDDLLGEWARDIVFSLKYEYLDVEIRNVDEDDAAQLVIDSAGRTRASGITPRLIRNTINNPLNPTEGSRQVLSCEVTGLGGDQEYYLFEATQQWYQPLFGFDFGDFVFSWRSRFGYGETFDGEDFPLYRRFFPGGINSVRGFKARRLGPIDEDGNEFGGSKQLVNNFEIIFPIVNSAGLRGVVFYDAGEAFDDDDAIELGDLRQAVGYGLRWFSPLGPIRIEFGHPLDRREGEESFVTLFSFGAPL